MSDYQATDGAVLQAINLIKTYQQGNQTLTILRNLQLTVSRGECLSIVGASGSGKSTLLNLLGGLDQPSEGQVVLEGRDLWSLNERQRGEARNRWLGFVYQFHHLLGEFTALENAAMPLLIGGCKPAEASERAEELLCSVGLQHRLHHQPAELSGGERQRVAIARALVTRPSCVLLDEPTGNLDRHNAEQVESLLMDLNQRYQTAVVLVTHDSGLAQRMGRVLELTDGQLVEQ